MPFTDSEIILNHTLRRHGAKLGYVCNLYGDDMLIRKDTTHVLCRRTKHHRHAPVGKNNDIPCAFRRRAIWIVLAVISFCVLIG